MNRWADFLLRHRGPAWIALIALTVLAGLGAARVEIDDVPSSIFRSGDEEFARLASVWRDFGSDDNDVIVFIEADDVFTPQVAAFLRDLTNRLTSLDEVAGVVSLAGVPVFDSGLIPRPLLPAANAGSEAFEAARLAARTHPLVGGRLVSRGEDATLLVVTFTGSNLPVSALDRAVRRVDTELDAATEGTELRARVTGVPVIRRVLFQAIERDQTVFSLFGALVGFVVGLVIFRRPGPVLITSIASVLSAFWALGAMGWIGAPINLINAELPLLVMIIAYTDAVHLMIHILRRRSEGRSAIEAAGDGVRHLGLACALTSFTTAVGFGSLALSRIDVIRSFGILFACATWMTFLVVITLVPLASARFLHDSRRPSLQRRYGGLHEPAERLIRWIVWRPRPVTIAGFTLTLSLLLLALRLVPDNKLTESLPSGHATAETLHDIERDFGGVLTSAVLIEWPEDMTLSSPEVARAVGEVRAALDVNSLMHAPTSVYDLLALLPGAADPARLGLLPTEVLRRYVRSDLRRTLVRATVPDAGSAAAEPAYAELFRSLAQIRARHPNVEINLTGTAYLARRNINLMISDFALGLAVAAVAIFGAISIAFRSGRLGAISILPNVLPLVVAAATLVLLGLELQVGSVIAFTVLLGIAVDDTIHYLARYRRERAAGHGPEEAAVQAFLGVGRALVVTTCVLTGGFAVLFASEIPTTRLFAGIGTIGLFAALLGDLFFLPAMVVLFARGNERQ